MYPFVQAHRGLAPLPRQARVPTGSPCRASLLPAGHPQRLCKQCRRDWPEGWLDGESSPAKQYYWRLCEGWAGSTGGWWDLWCEMLEGFRYLNPNVQSGTRDRHTSMVEQDQRLNHRDISSHRECVWLAGSGGGWEKHSGSACTCLPPSPAGRASEQAQWRCQYFSHHTDQKQQPALMQAFSLTAFLLISSIKANHHPCTTEQDRNAEQNCQLTYLTSRVSSSDSASMREEWDSLWPGWRHKWISSTIHRLAEGKKITGAAPHEERNFWQFSSSFLKEQAGCRQAEQSQKVADTIF